MTLRVRNTLLIILAAVSASGLFFIARALLLYENISVETVTSFLPVIVLNLFSTVSCIIIFLSFRNTASSEIFFYYIFIFSFIFDIFRFTDLIVLNFPVFTFYTMAPTRFVYYGRFAGALALFSAGLFTTGLEYQRMGIATIIVFTLPAALVTVLPVDVSAPMAGGTWEIGRFHEIIIAISALHLMAVLNFLIAGSKNESCEYGLIAAGLFTAVAGRELIYFCSGWVIIAGFSLMITGTIIFALRIHHIYLWD